MDGLLFPTDSPIELEHIEEAWWWVAYDQNNDDRVGYAALTCDPHKRGFLSRAGVLPQARGNGLQRGMIYARERKARYEGWVRMVTYTADHNTHSSNNLIACGYKLWVPQGGSKFLNWYKDL